ncbi:MAG TPA: neutral zinc metallopeptidase [Bryobacteraceae bacterium]|nr:neutral zinc metallopeptidase [Bryobacteraceae bacterium]
MDKILQFAIRAALVVISAALVESTAHGEGVEINQSEVTAMSDKVSAAASFVDATWTGIFSQAGQPYSAPRLIPFIHSVNTGCGILQPDNAHYCGADNAVYYDIEFFARLGKYTSHELRTDGSYAPITVLWHEVGHSVAERLGINPAFSRNQENLADCLAGVVMRQAAAASTSFEESEVQEGLFALSLGGDRPTTPLDSPRAHGSAEERQAMFNRGYHTGLPGCSESIATKLSATGSTATSFHGQ